MRVAIAGAGNVGRSIAGELRGKLLFRFVFKAGRKSPSAIAK